MYRILSRIYRVCRAVVFAAVGIFVYVYACLYIALALPGVQDRLRAAAERELSTLIGGRVTIGGLDIRPFSEIGLADVAVAPPKGRPCIEAARIGAGIDIWRLVAERRITITYAELTDLRASVSQTDSGAPLNIQFLIDAFAPRGPKKPQPKFDLAVKRLSVRNGTLAYDKKWCRNKEDDRVDFNHIKVTDLNVEAFAPHLRNDDFMVCLERLSCTLQPGLRLEKLAAEVHVTRRSLTVEGLSLQFPGTMLSLAPLKVEYDSLPGLGHAVTHTDHRLRIDSGKVTPSDFASLAPQLAPFTEPWSLTVDIQGDLDGVKIERFALESAEAGGLLSFRGEVSGLLSPAEELRFSLPRFEASASAQLASKGIGAVRKTTPRLRRILEGAGSIGLRGVFEGDLSKRALKGTGQVATSAGRADFDASIRMGKRIMQDRTEAGLRISTPGIDFGRLLGRSDIGRLAMDLEAALQGTPDAPSGTLAAQVHSAQLRGYDFQSLDLNAEIEGGAASVYLVSQDPNAQFELQVSGEKEGTETGMEISLDVTKFTPSVFRILPKYTGYDFSTHAEGWMSGHGLADLSGALTLLDTDFLSPAGGGLSLSKLTLSLSQPQGATHHISLASDWIDGEFDVTAENSGSNEGIGERVFNISALRDAAIGMASEVMPALGLQSRGFPKTDARASFTIDLKAAPEVYGFFKLPVFPLGRASLFGDIDTEKGTGEIELTAPYLQQGSNKLIRDTRISAVLDRNAGTCGVSGFTIYPAKKGDLDLDFEILARRNTLYADIGLNRGQNGLVTGAIPLVASFSRNPENCRLGVNAVVEPSSISVNRSVWKIERATLGWDGTSGKVDNLMIHHGDQFVSVDGVVSSSPFDLVDVRLAGIDVGYIFDTLNINYVTFGGIATGEAIAQGVLSKNPSFYTGPFEVKDLSYNGAVLGDARMESNFDITTGKVTINALARQRGRTTADIRGGVWIGRDSLSFTVNADRVNVEILNPFVSAFADRVGGYASGTAHLYGTFSDIDLTGDLKADSVGLRLKSTNVSYWGNDSIHLRPGRIDIPRFTIRDRQGHTGVLSGWLTHRYFHDPVFNFRVSEARNLLCYDTSATDNPDWYGTIYGSGSGVLTGKPGLVSVEVDMTSGRGSAFTFVLSDRESVEEYNFLSFTDKKKAARREETDTVPDFLRKFQKTNHHEATSETDVLLDFRATVTPDAQLTIVMDPEGGDKIVCNGYGALQMEYRLIPNELKMFGKYALDRGMYNFSLQDIILRDFTIRQGSSISFNGDPLDAILDISAYYRINTNLTDLDQSFANDRDLNRTSVPVDAVLNVSGPMTSPDITFDIDLPTLTSDVERKVKSLISTDDLMSRQIIYLLALGRFYTPEYTGVSSNSGAELSSVASTAISSQLRSVLSSLSDNLSVAPSFRSDKGDFSDMEVDLALSSRLLDNRLLINGNFGYRDRGASTSNTQFVGDFDVEYLLNRSGNLRLKAYNRFNDQNYYLRQALTTQGVGVAVHRDFDSFFSFLRPVKKWFSRLFRKKKEEEDVKGSTSGSNQ